MAQNEILGYSTGSLGIPGLNGSERVRNVKAKDSRGATGPTNTSPEPWALTSKLIANTMSSMTQGFNAIINIHNTNYVAAVEDVKASYITTEKELKHGVDEGVITAEQYKERLQGLLDSKMDNIKNADVGKTLENKLGATIATMADGDFSTMDSLVAASKKATATDIKHQQTIRTKEVKNNLSNDFTKFKTGLLLNETSDEDKLKKLSEWKKSREGFIDSDKDYTREQAIALKTAITSLAEPLANETIKSIGKTRKATTSNELKLEATSTAMNLMDSSVGIEEIITNASVSVAKYNALHPDAPKDVWEFVEQGLDGYKANKTVINKRLQELTEKREEFNDNASFRSAYNKALQYKNAIDKEERTKNKRIKGESDKALNLRIKEA